MSKYTAEQVESLAQGLEKYGLGGTTKGASSSIIYTDAPTMLREYAALLRERESAKVTGLDYTPGNLDHTAPSKIWLQVNIDGDNSDRDEPWPGADDVTWQDEPIGGLEIQYVRADLASARVPDFTAFVSILREAAEILSAIEPGKEPANMRWPIADELSGFAYTLAAAPKTETEE